MPTHWMRQAAGACVTLLALAALPGAALAKDTPEKPALTMAVGGLPGLYYLPVLAAQQLGYFKDEGLDVTLEDFAGGSKALEAVVGGSADVGAGAFEHTLFMQEKGQHYRAFALMGRAPQIVVAVLKSKADQFKTLADFKGAKVGVSAPGSSTDLVLTVALRKAGVQRNEISAIGVGSGASVLAAVSGGQIDALSNVDPMITKLARSGAIKVLVDTRTVKGTQEVFGGTMPAATLYASDNFIQKYPKTTQALANAIVRADHWLQSASDADLLKMVPPAYLLNDSALYVEAFHNVRDAYSPDGLMPADGPATSLRALSSFDNRLDPKKIDLNATYTNDFARKAAAQLK
ncbi:NitT/TauT family transport system substrate-binding protein [Paraburkholderia sp. BL18I3N2]|uniref:ABC transporter substrate-binding protein n=1 Tax=Paraburkholderia sp. BL18I3N2 TaxID=1938799 RepID=UPI000D0852EF|nr:ABC transporter substrate-binding protein [Paraburkholderia sp. BL18I3N2]PRX28385.1 NitT/TauT family transport system substrate-binding protein [Paraburkholderia sp. BL18I3N2]